MIRTTVAVTCGDYAPLLESHDDFTHTLSSVLRAAVWETLLDIVT